MDSIEELSAGLDNDQNPSQTQQNRCPPAPEATHALDFNLDRSNRAPQGEHITRDKRGLIPGQEPDRCRDIVAGGDTDQSGLIVKKFREFIVTRRFWNIYAPGDTAVTGIWEAPSFFTRSFVQRLIAALLAP